MKIKHVIVLFMLLVLAPVLTSAETKQVADLQARVVNVADGDTLIVSVDGEAMIVDLAGVVCPPNGDKGWADAKQFTSKMVMSKKVRIAPEGRNRLGRTVGRVYIDDRCLNDALVESGLARIERTKGSGLHI